MYHIKNDQRAKRSAEMMYKALVALMAETPYQEIKVSELVEQAQIGRATFFRSFDAIEDVLHWHCDQMIEQLIVYIQEYCRLHPTETMSKPVLRFFYLHSTIVELLIQADRTDILRDAFHKRMVTLQPRVTTLMDIPAEYLDYWSVIRSSVVVSVLIHWIREGKPQAPDDLADALAELTASMNAVNPLL